VEANMTDLARRAQGGDSAAAEELFALMYDDFHRIARSRLRAGGRSVLLDTTSLVNEWYLRFAQSKSAELTSRSHLLRYAATVMRSIVVDFARKKNAARRGGGSPHLSLTIQMADGLTAGTDEIVRVHEALDELAKLDERMSKIVEMRYFAGMNESEIAVALEISERTVRREWSKAKLWLASALS
jgi:RNA polymerase sigma factor (TIGR02999 family)